ncbi:hypothetical protein DFP88_102743 [Pseudoroseicyclus aestuarii]|uniref:Uncharacterized protein n=1 Tax=Pseudoroseicyclus aestuarii TaxID=1795041 RepID=A0A318SX77_9RHOB|nr:hypothetical protein DFP88_102743 [Pseudoroseicyclus aestuarii]
MTRHLEILLPALLALSFCFAALGPMVAAVA